jgi:Zn finger protein HypA/HybF involved in hydrogenase expression
MTEKSKLWIEAGKLFAVDSKVNILCPECKSSNLKSMDTLNENNLQEMERLIYCPSCEAKNYLRLKTR